ncbi:MAG TPA: hypothetical protein VIK18_19245 [Pirellulales bacterium]
MKRLCLVASLAVLISLEARGEQPATKRTAPEHSISLGQAQLTPTPDMWYYEQAMRQHADPRVAVRQKAEFDQAQRQRRLASQQWFGMSNSRPMASVTPLQGTYSPTWVGNSTNPMYWAGQGTPVYQSARPRMLIW